MVGREYVIITLFAFHSEEIGSKKTVSPKLTRRQPNTWDVVDFNGIAD